MKEEFLKFLRTYGQSFTGVSGTEQFSGKAFIQPARYKNRQYTDHIYGQAGLNEMDNYLYIGDPDAALGEKENAVLSACGKEFFVLNSSLIYVGDEAVYEWAILRIYHGEE
ncbi:MAG: hypothetical protein IJL87_05670 [Clostridia bacterium]|nr:hypothetical protein [Clostridia bacterium]